MKESKSQKVVSNSDFQVSDPLSRFPKLVSRLHPFMFAASLPYGICFIGISITGFRFPSFSA